MYAILYYNYCSGTEALIFVLANEILLCGDSDFAVLGDESMQ